jgi:hypothetical protein
MHGHLEVPRQQQHLQQQTVKVNYIHELATYDSFPDLKLQAASYITICYVLKNLME